MVALVDARRLVPRTDAVLADPRLAAAQQRLGRALVLAAVRQAQEQARSGSIAAAAFGSCFPTTIYIGHPGWKAMGARTGYSILNAVFFTIGPPAAAPN